MASDAQTPGPKLTAVRMMVLHRLADGDWHRGDTFHSAPPETVRNGLRGTRLGRKRRGLPYTATFAPMIAAGLIEQRTDQFHRREFRLTEAGRAAIKAEGR